MARGMLGTMTHETLHGLNDGGGDNPPSGGEELPVGESMPEPEKIPGQPDAERSGIPSPITSAARQPGAFQGKTTEDANLSQPTDIPHGDILKPGPNYKVHPPNYGYVDPSTGVPMDTNRDNLDRARGKLKTDEERAAFDINHPKGNFTAISDDEGKIYGSMPVGKVGDQQREALSDDEQKGILENFYKEKGQRGSREYAPDGRTAEK